MPERSEDNLVLTNSLKSLSRAQNRACEVTLAFSSLKKISNACNRDTSRSLLSQGFVLINLFAPGHQMRRKVKRKIVPG
jgi:hypothetical protein